MFRYRLIVVIFSAALVFGCNNGGNKGKEEFKDDIVQKQDGNIFLSIDDAYRHYDEDNPDQSTAEWGFTVNSRGRYEVWLSSLTLDTMNLSYKEPVIVHFGDKRLESQPVGNKIVLNDKDVLKPYFRADSRLGSILIEDTGHYNIQIISEKVIPSGANPGIASANTILEQIILIPQTH